jgi:hypothetical protein
MSDADETARLKSIPKERLECGRCAWIRTGKPGDEILAHDRSCPFRDSGTDPPADEGSNDGL